jgi:hypothetical protein
MPEDGGSLVDNGWRHAQLAEERLEREIPPATPEVYAAKMLRNNIDRAQTEALVSIAFSLDRIADTLDAINARQRGGY